MEGEGQDEEESGDGCPVEALVPDEDEGVGCIDDGVPKAKKMAESRPVRAVEVESVRMKMA